MKKSGGESHAHYALKWKAFEFLWYKGFRQIGFECDMRGFRPDVLGVKDCVVGRDPLVVAIEVKATREDFLRDANARQRSINAQKRIDALSSELHKLTVDTNSAVPLREQFKKINEISKKKSKQIRASRPTANKRSKFDSPAYLEYTTARYLIAPTGVIQKNEVPDGWGLLDENAKVIVRAPKATKKLAITTALVAVREIARLHTQDFMKSEINPIWRGSSPVFPEYDELLKKVGG